MLKSYASAYEITERHLTRKYIRRVSILSWFVFLSLLLEFINPDWALEDAPAIVSIGLIVIVIAFLIAVIMLLCSPLVMRFWARDKYLDEWELDIKRRGMKSGYTVLLFTLLLAMLYFVFKVDYSIDYSVEIEAKTVSNSQIAGWSSNLIIIAVFFQIQSQLRRIRPIDADEWDEDIVEKKTIKWKIFMILAVLFILFGPPACQGFIDGYNAARFD